MLYMRGMCHVCAGACRGQKRVWNPLKLEIQAAVSHLTQMLSNPGRSSAGAADALDYRASRAVYQPQRFFGMYTALLLVVDGSKFA